MRLDEYLAEVAVLEMKNLAPGTQFKIRDLFSSNAWDIVPLEIRQQAGLRFFEKVSNQQPQQVNEVKRDIDATLYEKI